MTLSSSMISRRCGWSARSQMNSAQDWREFGLIGAKQFLPWLSLLTRSLPSRKVSFCIKYIVIAMCIYQLEHVILLTNNCSYADLPPLLVYSPYVKPKQCLILQQFQLISYASNGLLNPFFEINVYSASQLLTLNIS